MASSPANADVTHHHQETEMLPKLAGLDFFVLAVTLGLSAAIGIYYRLTGGRQKTVREYLMANNSMSITPVAFSLMASFMSAVTLLGVPMENYYFGTQFFTINLAYIVGTPIAAFVFLPVFFRLQVVSAYDYLERRFGSVVRLLASGIFTVQMVFYTSVVLYAPAATVQAVTHLSKYASILSVGLVCTFYCTIGGMKAVLWTDVLQSILMFGSILAVLIAGTARVGGISNVIQAAQEGGRLEFWNISVDPEARHTIWSLLLGGMFVYVSLYGVNQAQVQRLLTVKSLKSAQKALFISWPILSALSFISCLTGLVIYANLRGCDPYATGRTARPDHILPYFVMKVFGTYAGLPGLFVAGIFSGALSTVSSAINSLAAVTYEDYIKPLRKGHSSYESPIVKIIALVYGVLCMLLTGMADRLGGVLQASFVFFGVGGGPLLGVFTLGMLVRRCSSKAALIGTICGLCGGIWLGASVMLEASQPVPLALSNEACPSLPLLTNRTSPVKKSCSAYFSLCNISYQWFTFVSWFFTVFFGTIATIIWPTENPVPHSYLSPIITGQFSDFESNKEHNLDQIDQVAKL